jgi:E3 ubiquitin-protein ligase synoviolin
VFGFEYAILMTIVANTVVKYVLHSVDLYSEAPWENKAVFMLYTELFIGLIKVSVVTPVPKVLSRVADSVEHPGPGYGAF